MGIHSHYSNQDALNLVPKVNYSGSAAPTAGDDSADGYSKGSIWVDTTNNISYICLDASSGAAIWKVTAEGEAGANTAYIYYGETPSRIQDCDSWDTSSWSSETSGPSPSRNAHAGAAIGSTGYSFAGTSGSNMRDCDSYDGSSWTSETDLPTPGRRQTRASTMGSVSYITAGND